MVSFELMPVLYFLIVTWCFGYTIRRFVKKGDDSFLESNLMNLGLGLGVIPILGTIFAVLRIQIVWWLFLVISLALPLFDLALYLKNIKTNSFLNNLKNNSKNLLKIKKSTFYVILVIVMFFCLFFVMSKGAFLNPWLEDGDSWGHMMQSKYIELHKTYYPPTEQSVSHYNIPYPQGYDILMGTLFQISDSSYWALKFFNAFIISLSIIFFYFFVKRFTNDFRIALFASFILTIIPSFLSHFIWSKTLAIILYFPAFYSIIRAEKDNRWLLPSIIIIASILITAPVTAFYFAPFLGIFWLGRVLMNKRLNLSIIIAGLGGFALSCVYWFDMFIQFTFRGTLLLLNVVKVKGGTDVTLAKLFNVHGTGATKYSLMDFIKVEKFNMINNPIGIGWVLSILVFVALIFILYKLFKEYKSFFKENNSWLIITIIWFVFALLSVLGEYFPIQMPYPFRAWSFLAIPVSILGAYGYFKLTKMGNKIKIPTLLIFIIIISGLFLTTGYQKYTVNTAIWPNENFYSIEETEPYVWMQDNLPKNTKVMSYCGDAHDVTGYDMVQENWFSELSKFYKHTAETSIDNVYSFMNKWDYDYIVVDVQCVKKHNETFTNEKLEGFMAYGKFTPIHQSQVGFIFKKV
jgi:hypothetical protein